jgi:hypothetical protein
MATELRTLGTGKYVAINDGVDLTAHVVAPSI